MVASPTGSSTRCTAGSPVVIAFFQVHSERSAARARAAAAKASGGVRSSRCSIGVCGGSGTTVTPGRPLSSAAIVRACAR